jgi:pyruvate decarboxylase
MAPSATHTVNIQAKEKGKIPLGAYIFHRLHELGISHVFGCPGDFNLNLLDHIYTVPSMNWVGTCNELNGAYATDGYARVRGIPGALVTTYGVGELSAINGISGAYSEHVPIIHIVGTTSRLARKDRIMIHHTLGENWDHDTFQRMSEPVRSASVFLLDDTTFTKHVDSVIETCVKTRRPVYIYIPMDTPDLLVDSSPLFTPLSLEITNDGQEDGEDAIVKDIMEMLEKAQQPTVLVDVLAHRYGCTKDVKALLERSGLPVRSPGATSR